MKIKYLFTGVLISMLAFMSCEDPDDLARTGSENVTGLTITGCLASDESTTYSAIVDEASNTINHTSSIIIFQIRKKYKVT